MMSLTLTLPHLDGTDTAWDIRSIKAVSMFMCQPLSFAVNTLTDHELFMPTL